MSFRLESKHQVCLCVPWCGFLRPFFLRPPRTCVVVVVVVAAAVAVVCLFPLKVSWALAKGDFSGAVAVALEQRHLLRRHDFQVRRRWLAGSGIGFWERAVEMMGDGGWGDSRRARNFGELFFHAYLSCGVS